MQPTNNDNSVSNPVSLSGPLQVDYLDLHKFAFENSQIGYLDPRWFGPLQIGYLYLHRFAFENSQVDYHGRAQQ
jgi:hypothetical protein